MVFLKSTSHLDLCLIDLKNKQTTSFPFLISKTMINFKKTKIMRLFSNLRLEKHMSQQRKHGYCFENDMLLLNFFLM